MSILGYQWRRARSLWWGNDVSTFRRLKRQGRVVVGRGTYGIPAIHTFAHDESRLLIGNYSSIGGTYLLGGQHAIDHVTTYPLRINMNLEGAGHDGNPMPRGDTVIGSDVWTGYGCWILSGVTIGDGAVVATGSVVTKDVPPFAIVGGGPAKLIRYRHSEEQIESLLKIKWWDWPEDEIRDAVPYLASSDVDAFVEYANEKQTARDPRDARGPHTSDGRPLDP